MAIYTTNYDTLHKLDLNKYMPVQISNSNKSGIAMQRFIKAIPDWNRIVAPYKQGRLTQTEYEKLYFEDLERWRDTIEFSLQSFHALATSLNRTVLLCCYEPIGQFCHRHLFAKYCNANFEYNITELILP